MTASFSPDDPVFQKVVIGGNQFPGIWRYMMPPGLFRLDFPAEKSCTCMDCPKVREEDWRADYRCCTYHPRVPNFMLGLAARTNGRAAVQRVLQEGLLIPEGMNHPPARWIDYLQDMEDDAFGRSERVLCPMLDKKSGYCNIHGFRNSVCSTFYCMKDHGNRGVKFWETLQVLGGQIEIALAQWTLTELGFDMDRYIAAYDRLGRRIHKVSGAGQGWDEQALVELWGDWHGREMELYEAAADLVLEHRDVLWEIADSIEIREAKKFDRAMMKAVPAELRHQLDEDDEEDADAEAVPPRELWDKCRKAGLRLWRLPEGEHRLNARVRWKGNTLGFLKKKGGHSTEWTLESSAEEKILLQRFARPTAIDWRLLHSPEARALENSRGFLARCVGKKILVRS